MKLQFLGTSAGEMYPAVWCHCPHCEYARTHGGRNLRRHSCALLDEDVLLDFSSHAFITAQEWGLDLTAVRTLLVTHAHADHFDPLNIICRIRPSRDGAWYEPSETVDFEAADGWIGPRFTPLPVLDVYGHQTVMDLLRHSNAHIGAYGEGGRVPADDPFDAALHPLSAMEQVALPDRDLTFTALPSHHGDPGTTYNYVIARGGKTLLYATDCGGYDPEVLAYLKTRRFDCVVVEGTFGLMRHRDPGHMNLDKNREFLRFFTENGLWSGAPRMILTHIAPHCAPPYDAYRTVVEAAGMELAYDGMITEI